MLCLLVDRIGGVPAPVDEQGQEDATGKRAEVHVGDEPGDGRMDRADGMGGVDLGERDHREDHQHEVLEPE